MKYRFRSIVSSMHWSIHIKITTRILLLGGVLLIAPAMSSAECPINNSDKIYSFFTSCQVQPTPTPIPGNAGAINLNAATTQFLVTLVPVDMSGATTKTIEDDTIKIVTADTGVSDSKEDMAYKQAVEDEVIVIVKEAPVEVDTE